jgi:hypothetical protein
MENKEPKQPKQEYDLSKKYTHIKSSLIKFK